MPDASPSTRPPPGQTRAAFGTLVFLASDIMLFAGFFAAYFFLRGQSSDWPPAGVELAVPLTVLATLALITSSGTMHLGSRAYWRGDIATAQRWLAGTVVLGGIFLAIQIHDYLTLDFEPSTHAYGSVYWMLTGLHGLHVSAGLILLVLLAVRLARAPKAAAAAMESTGYFWHLVDAVWIAVFLTIWVVR